MPAKPNSSFSITAEIIVGPDSGGPLQPSNSVANVSYYLVNNSKSDQYICMTVFSDKLSLQNMQSGKAIAKRDDRPSLAISQKPCKTKAEAIRLKADERFKILTASAYKEKDDRYRLNVGSHQNFEPIASGRYEITLEFNFNLITASITPVTATAKAVIDLTPESFAQVKAIEEFWKEFDRLLSLGPLEKSKVGAGLLSEAMKRVVGNIYFIEPPTQGEPAFPLGGIQMDVNEKIKISRVDLPNVYQKNSISSEPSVLRSSILKIGFTGQIFFYFDESDRLYNITIQWSSKSVK